jgi:dihydroorotase
VLPNSKTRIICFANIGTHAHTLPGRPDVTRQEDIDATSIAACMDLQPGLIRGFKLRLVGPFVEERGEQVIERSLEIARSHHVPLMVHIGYKEGNETRMRDLTRRLLKELAQGDILTHLCTAAPGRVIDDRGTPLPEIAEARANGVVLDTASGRGGFGYDVAQRQAAAGLHPDTISTDLTIPSRADIVHSLLECMAKFLALGYSVPDVVRMVTSAPARALGLESEIGGIAVGREADLTVFDVVTGRWRFVDTEGKSFSGTRALVPVQTIRHGVMIPPEWGPYARGWLPDPV